MLTLQEFIAKYTGQIIDFDPTLKNIPHCSCMSVPHQWLADGFGLTDPTLLAAPTAAQVFSNFANINGSQYFNAVANTPTGMPNPGDIGIIGPNAQGAAEQGHIFIVVSATEQEVIGFGQDWPLGSPCSIRTFSYVGLNWLTPKPQGTFVSDAEMQVINKQVQEAIAFEELQKYGYGSITDIDNKIQPYVDQQTKDQATIAELTQKNTDLLGEVSNYQKLANEAAAIPTPSADQALEAIDQNKQLVHDIDLVANELSTKEKVILYPPVSNLTNAIQLLQQANAALTTQANKNKAATQAASVAAVTASKGFFSSLAQYLRNHGWLA